MKITQYAYFNGSDARPVQQLAGLFHDLPLTVDGPDTGPVLTVGPDRKTVWPGDYYVIYDNKTPAVLRYTEFHDQRVKETNANA